jgi:site-specific DNA-adenine methylase
MPTLKNVIGIFSSSLILTGNLLKMKKNYFFPTYLPTNAGAGFTANKQSFWTSQRILTLADGPQEITQVHSILDHNNYCWHQCLKDTSSVLSWIV